MCGVNIMSSNRRGASVSLVEEQKQNCRLLLALALGVRIFFPICEFNAPVRKKEKKANCRLLDYNIKNKRCAESGGTVQNKPICIIVIQG